MLGEKTNLVRWWSCKTSRDLQFSNLCSSLLRSPSRHLDLSPARRAAALPEPPVLGLGLFLSTRARISSQMALDSITSLQIALSLPTRWASSGGWSLRRYVFISVAIASAL